MSVTGELTWLREAERQQWKGVLDHFDACSTACPAAGPRGCEQARALRASWKEAMEAVQESVGVAQ